MRRGVWKPVDIMVAVIVVVLGIGLLLAALTPFVLREPISDTRSEIIGNIIIAKISIVSMYVGARLRSKKDDQDDDNKS